MRTKTILAGLFVFLATAGFDCINDPIIVAVNLDPIEGCWTVNTGNGNFNDTEGPFGIRNFIPSDYRDRLTALRIYDITIHVHGPHPTGVVTGDGYFSFDGAPFTHLLHFSGNYSDFEGDVSILDSGGLITLDPIGMNVLVSAISNVNNLPNQVTLHGQGSGPAVTQNFDICCTIFFQASAEVD